MRHEANIAGLSSKLDVERTYEDGSIANAEAIGKTECAGGSRSTDEKNIPIPTLYIRELTIVRVEARPEYDFLGLSFIMVSNNRPDAKEDDTWIVIEEIGQ